MTIVVKNKFPLVQIDEADQLISRCLDTGKCDADYARYITLLEVYTPNFVARTKT